MWIIKDITFPDKGFHRKVGVLGTIATVIILLMYWMIGYQMMSGVANPNPSPERIFFCIMIYVIGVNLMMCADIQKYVTLKYRFQLFL